MTLEQLQQLRDAVPDDGQLPASATQADLAANGARRVVLDQRLRHAREAMEALATLGNADADAAWLAHLHAWRKVLDAELGKMPPRIRNERELGTLQNLTLSLKWLDDGPGVVRDSGRGITTLRLGELMREAGYEPVGADPSRHYLGVMPWHGSIKEVGQRIAALAARRQLMQGRLDAELMDDDVREQQEAESKRLRDALNGLRLRGPNLLVQDRDESDLTPLEKEALAWARRASRGEAVTS